MSIRYQIGLPESCRYRAAELYTEIIGQNLSVINQSREKVLGFYSESFIPELAVVALKDGRLVGFIGFYHNGANFAGGGGVTGAMKWIGTIKGFILAVGYKILFETKPPVGELAMDGFVVEEGMRGQGVGTGLFNKLREFGIENGYSWVRLRVAEDNERAIKLYERLGFKEAGQEVREYVKGLIGLSRTKKMIRGLD